MTDYGCQVHVSAHAVVDGSAAVSDHGKLVLLFGREKNVVLLEDFDDVWLLEEGNDAVRVG